MLLCLVLWFVGCISVHHSPLADVFSGTCVSCFSNWLQNIFFLCILYIWQAYFIVPCTQYWKCKPVFLFLLFVVWLGSTCCFFIVSSSFFSSISYYWVCDPIVRASFVFFPSFAYHVWCRLSFWCFGIRNLLFLFLVCQEF